MKDPLIGSWKLNTDESRFDSNHRPSAGTVTFALSPEGHYLMTAEGITADGKECRERPVRFTPDGQGHPVPDFPGLTSITTRPDAHTLASEVRREDGSVVGGGSYVISPDGQTMTATNFGYDTQLRQFQQQTVWDRQDQ
jgi:hypothetical protein